MIKNCIVIFVLSLVVLCSGCATLFDGGGPKPSFDVEVDLKELETHYGSAVAVQSVYDGGATPEKRDKMVAGRLVMMNLRYIQFIKSLNAEKQFIDTASDVLLLSLNLAGTAVSPAATKTVLAAISAGLAGTKTTVDKHYYYEKTMPALVATMNAQRKLALLPILQGMDKSIDIYSVEQTITDLDTYYHAGTLIGAINAIQATAGEQDKDATKEIEGITRARVNALLTSTARDQTKKIGDAIDKLSNLDNAKVALTSLGTDTSKITDISSARRQLIYALRARGHDEQKIKEMFNIFTTNKLF